MADDFDPDAYLATKPAAVSDSGAPDVGFDPDAYLKSKTQQPAADDKGALDAGARGVAKGATANFYDELRGLVEASGASPHDPASVYNLGKGAYK